MEAIEFLKEYRRMCNSCVCHYRCEGCPLRDKKCLATGICNKTYKDFLTITSVVEQWSKEHPIITNSKKFEEVFDFLMEDKFVVGAEVFNWLREPYKEQRE